MDTHLRFGEKYRAQGMGSTLHFDTERGLAGAIEHCNGQGWFALKSTGVCARRDQATREEDEFDTR